MEKTGGVAFITADHGNCDEMFLLDKHGNPVDDGQGHWKPKTSHTLSPVPFLLFDPGNQVTGSLQPSPEAGLANIAATVSELLGLPAPSIWKPSLLQWNS